MALWQKQNKQRRILGRDLKISILWFVKQIASFLIFCLKWASKGKRVVSHYNFQLLLIPKEKRKTFEDQNAKSCILPHQKMSKRDQSIFSFSFKASLFRRRNIKSRITPKESCLITVPIIHRIGIMMKQSCDS